MKPDVSGALNADQPIYGRVLCSPQLQFYKGSAINLVSSLDDAHASLAPTSPLLISFGILGRLKELVDVGSGIPFIHGFRLAFVARTDLHDIDIFIHTVPIHLSSVAFSRGLPPPLPLQSPLFLFLGGSISTCRAFTTGICGDGGGWYGAIGS